MKKLLIAFLMIICATPARSGIVIVKGTVIDANDERPLMAAGVCVKGTEICTIADDNGVFSLNVEETNYSNPRIEVSAPAYISKEFPLQSDLGVIKLVGEVLAASTTTPCTTEELIKTDRNAKVGMLNVHPKTNKEYCRLTVCKEEKDFYGNVIQGYLLDEAKNKCTPCTQILNGAAQTYVGKDTAGNDTCFIRTCQDKGKKPSVTNTSCITKSGDCLGEITDDNKKIAEYDATGKCVLKSCKDGYDVNPRRPNTCINKLDTPCKPTDQNATSGIIKGFVNGEITKCEITDCKKGWAPNDDGSKCIEICNATITQQIKANGAAEVGVSSDGRTCVAISCNDCNYKPVGNKCVAKTDADKACTPNVKGATSGEYACTNDNKSVCMVTQCDEPKYTMVGNDTDTTCQSNVGKPCDKLPEYATAGTQRENNGQIQCVIGACQNGYDVSPDELSCVPKMALSKEQYQDEIAELQKNADAMHERETSLANRAIGAAGIGAVGIGGSMLGAALSERASDADAEATTRAYLETFRCDYGAGKNIRGGEVNVGLPGGNDMIKLYTEYADTAIGLKKLKDALGIRPGIESEIVIDKSQTGLYDDVGTGITGGTYASIARALMNPDGEDAAMWAAQRAATKNKLVAGAITAGVGAVGSLAANIAVNHNNPNRVKKILADYAGMKQPFDRLQQDVNSPSVPVKKCSDFNGATGNTYPNCQCSGKAYFNSENGCVPCPDDLVVNDTKDGCTCPPEKPVQNGTSCRAATPACLLTGLKKPAECKCIDNATSVSNVCKCDNGYTETDGVCIQDPKPETPPQIDPGTTITKVVLNSDNLFDSGKAVILPEGERALSAFITAANTSATQANIDLKTATDYCLIIVGKTDHQGFLTSSKYYGKGGGNKQLSKDRANAVKERVQSTFNETNIRTYGIADTDCVPDKPKPNPNCRKVDIIMIAGSCDENTRNTTNWIGNVASAVDAVSTLKSQL